VSAAQRLGITVRESDYDRAAEEVRRYRVLNVPAVVIEDAPESLVVGAVGADQLVERLQRYVGDKPAPFRRLGVTLAAPRGRPRLQRGQAIMVV
jgi:hypothetical protein